MKSELEENDLRVIVHEVIKGIKPLLLGKDSSDSDVIFDAKGLAGYLGVKISWVRKHIVSHGLPNFKVGKYIRFRKSAIDQWIKSQDANLINSMG